MDRIEKELAKRNLPDFMEKDQAESEFGKQREKTARTLRDVLYGSMPFAEYETCFREAGKEEDAYGGRAVLYHILATRSEERRVGKEC